MDELVKISIIIPVYNAEKYIERCINSLINQTYENIEIILVNDGSIDSSLDILNRYSNIDNRIIVIDQKNSGVSIARNIGINKSTGDYIAFVDADDHVELNYIEKMINKVDKLKLDMSVCNYIEVRKEGNIHCKMFTFIEPDTVYNIDEKCLGEILCGRSGVVWGKLFNVSIIKDNNLSFNQSINMCEDLLFCLEFIKYAKRIAIVDEYLYIHNKYNDDSITAKYNKDLFKEQVKVQNIIELFLTKNNFYNHYTEKLLYERLKGILWFAIYKEIINATDVKTRLRNVKNIIENEIIVTNIEKFNPNGPIDNAILLSIKNKNIFNVYILGILRIKISNIRAKLS